MADSRMAVRLAWRKITGYANRRKVPDLAQNPAAVVEYNLHGNSASYPGGKKICFFTDLHCNTIFPTMTLAEQLQLILHQVQPDLLVFGGDLITYSCNLSRAWEFLDKSISNNILRRQIAVYGNWDRRRYRWYSHRNWQNAYRNVNTELLCNQWYVKDGIAVFGMDEPRNGNPKIIWPPPDDAKNADYRILVSHCIEPAVGLPLSQIDFFDLILCGHSHGGQVRIPGFGAISTSSRYWKLFEYGMYRHQKANTSMIISSGLGNSRVPFRIFCQPEIIIIKLGGEGEEGKAKQ